MLKKSLIGAYWNRLYDFGEKHSLFSCYGRITANSPGKELNVTNINTKGCSPSRKIDLSLNSSFL